MELKEAVNPDATQTEIGFSLQDDVRQKIWNRYNVLGNYQTKLLDEYSKNNGQVKVRTASEALNEMYRFVEDSGVEVKNIRYYHNKQLNEFDKFLRFYFKPQSVILNNVRQENEELIDDSENGFLIEHYINWKRLCYLFCEISGITKFERAQSLPAELGYGAS